MRAMHSTAGRCLLLALLLCLPPAGADWVSGRQDIMGTRITVEVFHPDDSVAQRGIDAVMAEMRRIDAAMSPFIDDSELSRVNREAAAGPVKISRELFDLLSRALHFSVLTHGAFDITFASAGFLYDYRRHVHPETGSLKQAVASIDYRNLALDARRQTVRFSKPGVKIDLGGIAKGHAVDRSIALLQRMGIQNALVTAGGDTRVIGARRGRPWRIGVRDPRRRDALVAMIPLQDVAVSTSGDYERFFEENGVRYHHIIDPATGDSARELRSVTIIGPDATTTDALSTSVFVLGTGRGLALIDRLPDIDAILVDGRGRLHYSSGLEQLNPR